MENEIRYINCDEIFCIPNQDGYLGKGLHGTVRCGFHKLYGTIAAKCSVVQGRTKSMKTLEKKVKNEIGLLQTSKHENIVWIHGWTQWQGAIAIIMEYFPGGNLMDILLDEDIDLHPSLRLRMGYEIANGLAFIHNITLDHRITHGDIKAENILLTEDLHCKIADFGSARLSAYTGGATMTTTEQRKAQFTELYAAPEVVEDPSCKPKPPRDTYSFGVTMYMLLVRKIPISPEHMLMYLEKVKDGKRPSLETIDEIIHQLKNDGCAADATIVMTLKSIVEKCWQQDPSLRPKMIDVKNILYEVLAEQDLVKVHEHMVNATKEMEMKKPSRLQYECVPLNLFSGPEFNFNSDCQATSSCTPDSLSTRPILNVNLDKSNSNILETASSKENEKQILAKIKSIKKQIKSGESLKEGVMRCESLIGDQINSVSRNDLDETIDDIIEIVLVLRLNNVLVTAANLLKWVLNVSDKISDFKLKLEKLFNLGYSLHGISHMMYAKAQTHEIEQYCLPPLKILQEKIKLVLTSNFILKAKTEARNMLYIGMSYIHCGKYHEADEMSQSARQILLYAAGEDAKNIGSFSGCYLLSAIAKHKAGNYKEAIQQYDKSIELRKTVNDLEKEVQSDTDLTVELRALAKSKKSFFWVFTYRYFL